MRAAVLALLLLTSCYQQNKPAPRGPSDKALMNGLRARTVQIMLFCDGKRFGSGSGVLLGGGYIATANHVAVYGCSVQILGKFVQVVERDPTHDVAILYHPQLSGQSTRLSTKPYLGEPIVCVGWPVQYYASGRTMEQVSRGHVIVDYGKRIRVSCSFDFGSSGGPVWDEHGSLVGLMVAANTRLNDEYLVAPARAVQEALENAIRKRRAELATRVGR